MEKVIGERNVRFLQSQGLEVREIVRLLRTYDGKAIVRLPDPCPGMEKDPDLPCLSFVETGKAKGTDLLPDPLSSAMVHHVCEKETGPIP